MKILIVDDNKTNLLLLKSALELENYYIDVAIDGVEAIRILENKSYDLILLDIMMPEMDGFEVCRQIKNNPELRDIPVIFLTALGDATNISRGFKYGASDYVSKPFNIPELLARVKVHIDLKKSNEQLESTLLEIKQDLKLAKKIQNKILLNNINNHGQMNIFIKYLPMIEVGGDFYDIDEIRDGLVRVFLADATGHGIQAALITMAIKGIYESRKKNNIPAKELMKIINNEFIENFDNLQTFFTCVIVDINLYQKKINFVSGGHIEQFFIRNNDEITMLDPDGTIIGLGKDLNYENKEITYQSGDKLLLFTDGIYEQFNNERVEFGFEKFCSIIEKNRNENIEFTGNEILKELDSFLGDIPKGDDLTFIGISF
jgi:Amt family ammonium transporter